MILIARSWEVTKEVRKFKAVKRSWLSKSFIVFWAWVFRSNCWTRIFFSVFYAQNLKQTEYCWLKIRSWLPNVLFQGTISQFSKKCFFDDCLDTSEDFFRIKPTFLSEISRMTRTIVHKLCTDAGRCVLTLVYFQ